MFNSKAFHFASAALVALISAAGAFHWGDLVSVTTAAEIVAGLGTAKGVIALFAGDDSAA